MTFQESPFETRFLETNDNGISYSQQYETDSSPSLNLDSKPPHVKMAPVTISNTGSTFKRQPSANRYEPRFHAHLSRSSSKRGKDDSSSSSNSSTGIFGQKDCRSKVYHQMLFSNGVENKTNIGNPPKPSNTDNIMTEFVEDSEDEPPPIPSSYSVKLRSDLPQSFQPIPSAPVNKSTPISPRFIINPSIYENAESKKDNSNTDLHPKSNLLKQNAALFTFQEGKFSMNDSQAQETWKDSKPTIQPLVLSQKPTSKKSPRSPRLLGDFKQFSNENNSNNNTENEKNNLEENF
ncbi:hypothetical protein M9Y10_026969 [Tritrichomonas musculus]|uniref:Uncharacterized protein n=1 Tax=Tritrichomonas musculus TaxID=1915356 RepID=A0ABR2H7I7_9EUKA